ncbi:MAG: exo-alpha-sialidase [Comamonadaceae bacterium]|nr:exo-alpha-sialidase [Comamonadaceae bacterium]
MGAGCEGAGYLDDTFTPFLLADRNRTVHAFASQWVENEAQACHCVPPVDSVGGWTRPVDILLSPIGGNANFLGAYLDSSDTMHVILMATEALTRRTSVYYSSAPAASADWAPSWSAPVPVADGGLGLNSAALTGDDQGNLVIIYSGNRDGSGVYYVHSKDSGTVWSTPSLCFSPTITT